MKIEVSLEMFCGCEEIMDVEVADEATDEEIGEVAEEAARDKAGEWGCGWRKPGEEEWRQI